MIVSSPKSQHSQDKNLTPISQKKLAGIEITPSRAGSQTVGVQKKVSVNDVMFSLSALHTSCNRVRGPYCK